MLKIISNLTYFNKIIFGVALRIDLMKIKSCVVLRHAYVVNTDKRGAQEFAPLNPIGFNERNLTSADSKSNSILLII